MLKNIFYAIYEAIKCLDPTRFKEFRNEMDRDQKHAK